MSTKKTTLKSLVAVLFLAGTTSCFSPSFINPAISSRALVAPEQLSSDKVQSILENQVQSSEQVYFRDIADKFAARQDQMSKAVFEEYTSALRDYGFIYSPNSKGFKLACGSYDAVSLAVDEISASINEYLNEPISNN